VSIESLGGLFGLSNRAVPERLRTWLLRLGAESCPRCGFESNDGFCDDCRREFPRIASPCERCGLPLRCDPCPALAPDWHIVRVRAPFVYGPPLARYIQELKYGRKRHLARPLGRLVANELETAGFDIDALAAVPLHSRRLRARTFDQAAEIAAAIARAVGRPLCGSRIRRTLDTRPQTELDRRERMRGPLRAFRVDGSMAGMRIAIVDDVITTGATVNALGSALKAAGAIHVEAWAVARSVGTRRVG